MCQHVPSCPAATATDHAAARVVAAHPEQGWSLLCNGVIAFSDGGELLPPAPLSHAPRQRRSCSSRGKRTAVTAA